MRQIERDREAGKALPGEVMKVYEALTKAGVANDPANTDIGSTIFANMPGDGSAREQAASCQRVMVHPLTLPSSTPPSVTAPTASTGA